MMIQQRLGSDVDDENRHDDTMDSLLANDAQQDRNEVGVMMMKRVEEEKGDGGRHYRRCRPRRGSSGGGGGGRHRKRMENNNNNDKGVEKATNEKLLCVAFLSFMGFTTIQTIAAFIAKSEAMMGDSAAMAVDAMTYAFNLYAERMKNRMEKEEEVKEEEEEDKFQDEINISTNTTASISTRSDYHKKRLHQRRKRRKRKRKKQQQREKRIIHLTLEIVPPLVSVLTLIVLTIIVLREAITVLILDTHRSVSEQSNPNIDLMFVFAALNLLLDGVNVFCFTKADHGLGYGTEVVAVLDDDDDDSSALEQEQVEEDDNMSLDQEPIKEDPELDLDRHEKRLSLISLPPSSSLASTDSEDPFLDEDDCGDDAWKEYSTQQHKSSLFLQQAAQSIQDEYADDDFDDDDESGMARLIDRTSHDNDDNDAKTYTHSEKANLNMCSAYTHVFADTLRSIAVIIAAILAEFVEDITPEIADSTAAVVVSVVILLSLIPLFSGLMQTWKELRLVYAEDGKDDDDDDEDEEEGG